MKATPKAAARNYRKRLSKRGLVRVEVQASPADAELLRSAARILRADPVQAARLRRLLGEIIGPDYAGMNFKELLEAAPLEDIDLTRRKDPPRDVEL
jgi:hypothetical protein